MRDKLFILMSLKVDIDVRVIYGWRQAGEEQVQDSTKIQRGFQLGGAGAGELIASAFSGANHRSLRALCTTTSNFGDVPSQCSHIMLKFSQDSASPLEAHFGSLPCHASLPSSTHPTRP